MRGHRYKIIDSRVTGLPTAYVFQNAATKYGYDFASFIEIET